MEKGLLNTIQKGPLGIFQILVGTGREVRLAFLHYLSTFSYLWLAPTVLYFLFNFLECMCSYILYKWYFGVNSRIANVKCLKTDTDPKKKGFPHSSYTDSWAVRCTEIPFHIFSRRAKNFQVWHCYFSCWQEICSSDDTDLDTGPEIMRAGIVCWKDYIPLVLSLQLLKCLSGDDNSEYLTWAEFFV